MNTPVAPVQGERPTKFTGEDFKRWQQRDHEYKEYVKKNTQNLLVVLSSLLEVEQ